ncbi:MAG TPA: hypothetical protein VM051_00915 [Usitatibacter sp.]|nr:hypothetical protein [Usitatibacter sp.]
MWSIARLAAAALLCAAPAAWAEPRIPALDSELERWLARGDYVFVWDIDRPTLGRGDPYRVMRTYYDGLMYALTEGRRFIEPGTPAILDMKAMPAPRDWEEAYAGTVRSRETYLGGDVVTLNAEITRRDCTRSRSQVFYLLSPKPRDHADWDEMRKGRDRIPCEL